MKKTFYSNSAEFHYYVCLIGMLVLLGILFVNSFVKENKLPRRPEVVKVDNATVLYARVNDKNVEVKVKAGTEVKVLGAVEGSYASHPERLWVELEDGTRGDIPCTAFDVKYKAQMKDSKKMKKVEVKGIKDDQFICILGDGQEKEFNFDDVYPQWPKSWDVRYLSSSNSSYYISKSKFEKKFIGSEIGKNDRRYRPARYVVKQDGVLYACYPIWIINKSDGMRYKPTVRYDESGVAVSYYNESSLKRAKMLVKILPFLTFASDSSLGADLIEGSMYTFGGPSKEASNLIVKIFVWLLAIIYLAFVLLWLYATPMIPVLLIGVLMHYPKVFHMFSNGALRSLILIVSAVLSYLWLTLLVVWGIPSLFVLPMLFIPLAITMFVCGPLGSGVPCGRCPDCHNIEPMKFVESVYSSEYIKWMRETEYVKKIGEKKRKYKTWTDVTKHWSDGSTTHSQENVQYHTETIRTDLYDDYNVLYNVTVYQNNYRCQVCGHMEHDFSEKYKEIDRKYMGTHQETTVE